MRRRTAALGLALAAGVSSAPAQQPTGQDKPGIKHAQLLRGDLSGVPGKELIVWDTEYEPNAVNPKHYHPAQVTFYVLEGRGIWQEDGKPPVALRPGGVLTVKPGTIHAHWNVSSTARLRFLEFVIVDKDQRSSVPMR